MFDEPSETDIEQFLIKLTIKVKSIIKPLDASKEC